MVDPPGPGRAPCATRSGHSTVIESLVTSVTTPWGYLKPAASAFSSAGLLGFGSSGRDFAARGAGAWVGPSPARVVPAGVDGDRNRSKAGPASDMVCLIGVSPDSGSRRTGG